MRIKPEARKTIKRRRKKKKQKQKVVYSLIIAATYIVLAHNAVAAIELNNVFFLNSCKQNNNNNNNNRLNEVFSFLHSFLFYCLLLLQCTNVYADCDRKRYGFVIFGLCYGL